MAQEDAGGSPPRALDAAPSSQGDGCEDFTKFESIVLPAECGSLDERRLRRRNPRDFLDSGSGSGCGSDSDSDAPLARLRVWRGQAQGGLGMRKMLSAATSGRFMALLDHAWFMPEVAGQLRLGGHRSLSCVCRQVQFAMHQTEYAGIKVRRVTGQRGG